jgi:Ca-activated chloride channel family protein
MAAQADNNAAHMVLVNVTVLDHTSRAVPGLEAEQFAVMNERSPHAVTYFSNADEPTSLVVVLDATAGMAAQIDEERKALAEFIHGANPQDELALIVIHDEPQVAVHLGGSANEIERMAGTIQADGFGSMWDGMYLSIAELQSSRCRRKAMIVISDDGEKYSRQAPSTLMSVLKQADVQVYAIGRFDQYANRFQVRTRALQLDEVTSVTGGRVLSGNDLSRAAAQIAYELRHQYILGFYPSNPSRDGQWHELKVRLLGSVSTSKCRIYAQTGYTGRQ